MPNRTRTTTGRWLLLFGFALTLLVACAGDHKDTRPHDAVAGEPSLDGGSGPEAQAGDAGSGAGARGASGGSSGSAGVAGAGTPDGGSLDSGGDGSLADGTLGPTGGTVMGPAGASITVPKGALAESVVFGIAEDGAGAPSLPAGMVPLGSIYAFTPHGTPFAKPVTVRVPFDASSAPSDASPLLLQAEPGGSFVEIPAQVDGDAMTASVSAFSWFVVARTETLGALLVTIAPDPDSGTPAAIGDCIRTGPAGSVYVLGEGILENTYSGAVGAPCFITKLTVSLGLEWVHQDDGCRARQLAVGPTGNVYFIAHDSTGSQQFLSSLNPSGAIRAGFPVPIDATFSVQSILVDAQDNATLVGTLPAGNLYYMTYAAVASFNGSGKVVQGLGALSLGAPVSYARTSSTARNNAGLFVSGEAFDSSGTSLGGFRQRYDSSGSAAPGFPILQTASAGLPIIVTLPATNDIVSFVPSSSGANGNEPAQMLRYHEDGTLVSSFPHALEGGNTVRQDDVTTAVSDGQGNVYFLSQFAIQASTGGIAHVQEVLSFTGDGALRAGYPRLVGYEEQTIHSSIMYGMDIDVTGTLYFTGVYHVDNVGQMAMMIQRLPAR